MARKVNPDYKTFALRFKYALDKKGFSQKEFSEMAELSASIVSCYINSKVMPDSGSIYVIAKMLDVSPVWLMGMEVNIDGSPKMIDSSSKRIELAKFVSNSELSVIERMYSLLVAANWLKMSAPDTDTVLRHA